MSCAEVFSYVLVLKVGGDRADGILELLEPAKREEVQQALQTLKSMAPERVRQLWRERRSLEEESVSAVD
jgi:flagellar motor switch protein FliG